MNLENPQRRAILAGGVALAAAAASPRAGAVAYGSYSKVFTSRIVKLRDTELEICEAGSGKLVFVCTHPYADANGPHPAGGLTEAFAKVGRTIYVCPRGTGRSAPEADPAKLTMSQLADDMEEIRKALKIDRWSPTGTSTGGCTALLYALRYPAAINGLVPVCTAASWKFKDDPNSVYNAENTTAKKLAAIQAAHGINDEYLRIMADAAVHNKAALPALAHKKVSLARAAACVEELWGRKWDVQAQLPQIKVPTLVFAGRYDNLAGSLRYAFEIVEGVPNAELVVMNNSGHSAYDEEPARFQDAVAGFVRRNLS